MPNRILRDWTDSENIDRLDVHAERFFTRLIMKVDDFGRYSANIKLLKSHLFPLKSDIRETDITRFLTACEKSGLIALYNVAHKEYLQIENFKQVLRQKIEKYPSPTGCGASAKQMTSSCDASASLKRNEVETETEVEEEGNSGKPPTHTQIEMDLFKSFESWVKDKAPAVGRMKEPFTIDEYFKLKTKFSKEQVSGLILKMGNYKPLLTKNISAYRTFLNWSERDYEQKQELPSGPTPAQLKAQRILSEVN